MLKSLTKLLTRLKKKKTKKKTQRKLLRMMTRASKENNLHTPILGKFMKLVNIFMKKFFMIAL